VTLRQYIVTTAMTAALVGSALPLAAQGGEKYTARLGWVPTAGAADRANVTGKGSATGTLSGRKLTIAGSFEGLAAPATIARLHQGVAKGARGAAITDLTVSKAASGMLSGAVDLTPAQVDALRQGKLYIQLHSEKGSAPDGSNLWGWFLK
jgi:CHRD domain-containing protein